MIGSWFWPRTRKSHPLSKLLRPVFEDKRLKRAFGVSLVSFVFLSGLLFSPASAFETYKNKEDLVSLEVEVEIETKKGFQAPLKEFSISQGYWLFHPAVDMSAPKGTPVYPVMAGEVEKVEFGHFGYGNNIIINHGNKIKSRYAHLSKIEVKRGDKISQTSIIGRVGSTGWATGNHLHLEIKEGRKYLNPQTFLP